MGVEVARRNAESELVRQSVYLVAKEDKRALLVFLLAGAGGGEKITQALVFTRTKYGADKLAKNLGRDGVSAAPIHGDRSQPQRTRALADFKAGAVRVLVATDIAARGLDIDQLPHVINFELPAVPEDYVHRIGRTGRAGSPGDAFSLVSPEELPNLAAIEKLQGKKIARRETPASSPRRAPRRKIRARQASPRPSPPHAARPHPRGHLATPAPRPAPRHPPASGRAAAEDKTAPNTEPPPRRQRRGRFCVRQVSPSRD